MKVQCLVEVQLTEQVKKKMPLIVAHEGGSNLLGLAWSNAFSLSSGGISALKSSESALCVGGLTEATKSVVEKKISLIKTKYAKVFSEQLEKCSLTKVSAKPIYFNPRPIPFAIKQRVQDELNRLVIMDVLSEVDYFVLRKVD